MTTTINPETTARNIIAALTGYAKQDAKLWVNHGKCRIYFGRKYVELFADGSCDVGSNPYSVSEVIGQFCTIR